MTQIKDPNLGNINSLLREMYASLPASTQREKDEGLICLEVDLYQKVSKVIIITYIFSDTRGAHYFKSTEEALEQVTKWYVANSYQQRNLWD